MALSGKWFDAQATPEQKKQRELTIRSSRFTLDLLSQVIEQQIKELEQVPFEDYNAPGWDYREADRRGQARALRNILKMTKLETQGVKTND